METMMVAVETSSPMTREIVLVWNDVSIRPMVIEKPKVASLTHKPVARMAVAPNEPKGVRPSFY